MNVKMLEEKQYLTKSDIQKAVRCSWPKACQIFEMCWKSTEKSGYENLSGKIYYKKFMDFMGVNE